VLLGISAVSAAGAKLADQYKKRLSFDNWAWLRNNGWLPTPMERLAFPSIVAASTNDPLARFTRALQMARAWGSRVVRIGNVGHLNPASGYGRWRKAHEFIAELSATPAPESLAR
jgi:predicted alpha/beta hydrolase family esterase